MDHVGRKARLVISLWWFQVRETLGFPLLASCIFSVVLCHCFVFRGHSTGSKRSSQQSTIFVFVSVSLIIFSPTLSSLLLGLYLFTWFSLVVSDIFVLVNFGRFGHSFSVQIELSFSSLGSMSSESSAVLNASSS